MKGIFITLEGIDGAGKSTHLPLIQGYFRRQGREIEHTREPGGTPLGEQLRTLLLNYDMQQGTEVLLMFAARHEHWCQRIAPALEAGKVVICDRFSDASLAYQGGGRGYDEHRLRTLMQWAHEGRQPDLTLLFTLPPEVARVRLHQSRTLDRFEQETSTFFERVQQRYVELVAAEPSRFLVVDSQAPIEKVANSIEQALALRFPDKA